MRERLSSAASVTAGRLEDSKGSTDESEEELRGTITEVGVLVGIFIEDEVESSLSLGGEEEEK